MLSKLLLSVFVFFGVLSVALASSRAEECKESLRSLLGTENETQENVKKVIRSPACRHLDSSVLEIIVYCNKIDVAREILYSVQSVSGRQCTSEALTHVINKVFAHYNNVIRKDHIEHDLIRYCLRTLMLWGFTIAHDDTTFQELISYLVHEGNIELLKGLLAIGCKLPPVTESHVIDSKNPTEVLKFYVYNGPVGGISNDIKALFLRNDFTSSDFKAMIKDLSIHGYACMDAALYTGRLDLAYIGYKYGFRLPASMKSDSFFYEKRYTSTPIQLAEYIAMKESFQKAKVFLEAMVDENATMPYLPIEILINHIVMTMNAFKAKDILPDLFSAPIQRHLDEDVDESVWD